MDAHLFRRFCEDFAPALVGVRIEKIHQIVGGVTVFTLYGLGKLQVRQNEQEEALQNKDTSLQDPVPSLFSDKKQYLVFKEGRNPLLFISDHRPVTGAEPPAFIMRLRKHLAGKRIERVFAHWLDRKLYMEIQGATWICLDLRQGIDLILERPHDIFPISPTPEIPHISPIPSVSQPDSLHGNAEQNEITYVNPSPKNHSASPLSALYLKKDTLSDDQEVSADTQEPRILTSSLLPFYLSYSIEPALTNKDFDLSWPDWEHVFSWCQSADSHNGSMPSKNKASKEILLGVHEEKDGQAIWKNYPVLTPLFRKTIPYLDKEEGASLYADLQFGGGDIVVYTRTDTDNKKNSDTMLILQDADFFEICPWTLPAPLAQKMGFGLENSKELLFEDSISALMYIGSLFLVRLSQSLKNTVAKPLIAEAKRLDRLLDKLDKEEKRLLQMLAKKEWALLLQANLYGLNSEAKEKKLSFEDVEGIKHTVELDPAKTIRENMESFFHVAGRGKRGLEHLDARRLSVIAQKEQALQHALQETALQKGFETNKPTNNKSAQSQGKKSTATEKRLAVNKGTQFTPFIHEHEKDKRNQSVKNKQKFPSQVQSFRSSDGFLILRGRDTKGNGLVLKMSNPHDYWVHIAEGAGAHVIIRRDHPQQEIPMSTLEEAGILALLKSWQKDQDKGLVQYSLAKYIRPMKGAGAGMVHVDKSEGSFLVSINPHIEKTLSF